jgi:hypothetical protein
MGTMAVLVDGIQLGELGPSRGLGCYPAVIGVLYSPP